MKRRAFLAGLCATAAPAFAQSITGVEALSGGRFRLGDQDFQLADIRAPSAYALHADAEPYFAPSKRQLQSLLGGRAPEWEEVAEPTRWGEKKVIASVGGVTLQERLVEEGAARAAPETDNLDLIDRLLALEKIARDDARGLWALRDYRVFDAKTAAGAVGGYNLVEGAVKKSAKIGGRVYLNFGDDYRTDFTAGAASRLAQRWAKSGLDLAGLEGATVRVRGYVDEINGPSIDLVHIRCIEILS